MVGGNGAAVLVLIHSPLTGPEAWGALPDALRARGRRVVEVEVRDDHAPPYAAAFVARAATAAAPCAATESRSAARQSASSSGCFIVSPIAEPVATPSRKALITPG